MKKRITACACLALTGAFTVALLSGCGAGMGFDPFDGGMKWQTDGNTVQNYEYESIKEIGFLPAGKQPSSYLSLDRNTAGYSLVRAQINAERQIANDSVRIEEMLNYFSYGYPAPERGEGLRATAYLSDCPWYDGHKLVTVGVKSEERVLSAEKNNYVFLVDVSGSMSARVEGLENQTCLDLVKYGIGELVKGLGDADAVSVVTYASGVETKLEPTFATKEGKEEIMRAVNALNAYGSTNGSGGLQLAYKNAGKYYSDDGNNRVVLMTDGDFNVGIRDSGELKEFVQEKAKSGVYLSVLGFGMGNLRDDFMQTLALNGNGNYAYIDTPQEAVKVLSEELAGLLTPVAKDAKAKITFNADAVEEYRIIGYDMKTITEDDYNNSEKDAGEIGSNLCVTALYEVALKEGAGADEKIADIEIRFKSVEEGEAERNVTASLSNRLSGGEDQAFISCVAEFGLILRNSQYKGGASLSDVLSRLSDLSAYTERDVYKREFGALVQKAKQSGYYE